LLKQQHQKVANFEAVVAAVAQAAHDVAAGADAALLARAAAEPLSGEDVIGCKLQ